MTLQFHPDNIIPTGAWIFVYGSNEAGRHGRGAAKVARIDFRAEYGVGQGRTGDAYAIPTKDADLKALPLRDIDNYVREFLAYAEAHPDLNFFVTRVGCGLAGYRDEQIGPMFAKAPRNCSLPNEWRRYVEAEHKSASWLGRIVASTT